MISRLLVITAAAKSLTTLLGQASHTRCSSVIMQAPSGNAGVVYYGCQDEQPMTLAAGSSVEVPLANTDDLWLKGTANDTLGVFVATAEN
jgi:hypothetical protein